ncbi:hypothetical protein AB1Y20_013468 [Prymnesium parvum]|uniref:Uncharacterized protein n=1 Tax=Prymnesium parvum TaxID=97485 RepID=A0AB34IIT3_PRYPA
MLAAFPSASLALAMAFPRAAPQLGVHPAAAACPPPRRPLLAPRLSAPRMQGPVVDSESSSFYDEYQRADPKTGQRQPISFQEKEKLYLECLDAFYNEGGKQLLPDDEYEQLKNDLNFEGSTISTLSKDEIRFVLANKRYKMGKPILSDAEYNQLRATLKEGGSPVVLHEAPSCDLDGICKVDLRVDEAKQRLLYLPGTLGSVFVLCELFFWTLHTDPLLSVILAAVPSYFIGVWFTENIFCQKPLVTVAACPECNYLVNAYFGDVFNVQKEGIIPGPPTGNTLELSCPNCKSELVADREKMIISTTVAKGAAAKK